MFKESQHNNWSHNFQIVMYSIEDYTRAWAKRKEYEMNTLSEWVNTIRCLIERRILKLKKKLYNRSTKVRFQRQETLNCLTSLKDMYSVCWSSIGHSFK